MGTYSPAVTCHEMEGSRSETFESAFKGSASVILKCAWADRMALIEDIVGLRRAHPDYVGLRAKSASPKGFGTPFGDGQTMYYSHALVTVSYETLSPNEDEDGDEEVLDERLEPNAEFMLLPHQYFQWGEFPSNEDLKAEEAPGLLVRSATLCRNWKRVVGPLPTELVDLIGCVNDSPYYSVALNQTFPTETLLYVPPVLSRTIRRDAVDAWNIDMKFMFRKETWNKYFRAQTATWEYIRFKADESIYRSYSVADISGLLVI